MKLPAFQFYTGDWLKDPRLSLCAPETRGVWIDLLCAMHELNRSGELCATTEQLARLARCSTVQLTQALTDLQTTGAADVTDRNGVVTVICRRMKREAEVRNQDSRRQNSMRQRGGGDPERWTAIRAPILVRDAKVCAYCGRRATTVDHVIPKTRGGTEDATNLVACCRGCNNRKGNRTPEEAQMPFWKGFDSSVINSHAVVTPESHPPSSSSVSTSTSSARAREGSPLESSAKPPQNGEEEELTRKHGNGHDPPQGDSLAVALWKACWTKAFGSYVEVRPADATRLAAACAGRSREACEVAFAAFFSNSVLQSKTVQTFLSAEIQRRTWKTTAAEPKPDKRSADIAYCEKTLAGYPKDEFLNAEQRKHVEKLRESLAAMRAQGAEVSK